MACRNGVSTGAPAILHAGLFRRGVCLVVEYGACVLLLGPPLDALRERYLPDTVSIASALIVLWLGLLVLGWGSAAGGTPVARLFDIAVVSAGGGRLSRGRALLRAAGLAGLLVGCAKIAEDGEFWVIVAASLGVVLVLLTALSPRRQALHDLLAGSVVVRRRVLRDPALVARLAAGERVRPRLDELLLCACTLGLFVLVLHLAAKAQHARELRAAASVAVIAAAPYKEAVAAFHARTHQLPHDLADLGPVTPHTAPMGARYTFAEGQIVIQFAPGSELERGELVLVPAETDGELGWTCHGAGGWSREVAPASCRD